MIGKILLISLLIFIVVCILFLICAIIINRGEDDQ